MKIHIEILDDNNEIVGEHMGDASTPSVWNAPSGKPLVSKMPQNSDNENTGTYELYRLTIQPVVRISRPNGYKEPLPSPLSGLPRPLYDKQPSPWGTSAPTPSKTGLPDLSSLVKRHSRVQENSAPQSIGLVPTRGY